MLWTVLGKWLSDLAPQSYSHKNRFFQQLGQSAACSRLIVPSFPSLHCGRSCRGLCSVVSPSWVRGSPGVWISACTGYCHRVYCLSLHTVCFGLVSFYCTWAHPNKVNFQDHLSFLFPDNRLSSLLVSGYLQGNFREQLFLFWNTQASLNVVPAQAVV